MTSWQVLLAMCSSRSYVVVLPLLTLSVLSVVIAQKFNGNSSWKTLSGDAPLVVARGGFSGVFPDSSSYAYEWALMFSVPDVVLWCDVQLTKDGVGICVQDMRLENSTNIAYVFDKGKNGYLVNGNIIRGWFSIDFNLSDLEGVYVTQGVSSRTIKFDGNMFKILTVKDVAGFKPPGLWLNIQHDVFFSQHNLSMRSFVLSASKTVDISFVSSPEVFFLRSIAANFVPSKTKLIFRFLGKDEWEPSTNQTYGSLLKNLTFIKTFASGILVPKSYIWPIDENEYLEPHTSIVLDAHKEKLEVFASDFYNDVPISYNYSYDPVSEHLSFIDNDDFSVDGVLSDFPVTSSEAIGCFAHLKNDDRGQARPLVISRYGASGDFPGCTDLAYQKAISDGVDVLDCPVQMAKDGTPFCLSSIDLTETTTVIQTGFNNLTKSIPALKTGDGIFTFDLTWPQIKNLTPEIASPFSKFTLFRNPKYKYDGTFLTLSEFLALAKNTGTLSGILLSIEHAAFLAEEQGLSVTDAVLQTLSKSGYDNQVALKVMIKSSNSSVLRKFKGRNNYELVYKVDETIRDALNSTIADIKDLADAVIVSKASVFPENWAYVIESTKVVPKLQSFKLSVYVESFTNEFVSQAYDFFSDIYVEINSFFMGANVDGIITDFPLTAARYKKNKCLNLGDKTPPYMRPIQPGKLIQLITQPYLPPAAAPLPILTDSDVLEPPLPAVSEEAPTDVSATPTPTPNGQPSTEARFFLLYLEMFFASFSVLCSV